MSLLISLGGGGGVHFGFRKDSADVSFAFFGIVEVQCIRGVSVGINFRGRGVVVLNGGVRGVLNNGFNSDGAGNFDSFNFGVFLRCGFKFNKLACLNFNRSCVGRGGGVGGRTIFS